MARRIGRRTRTTRRRVRGPRRLRMKKSRRTRKGLRGFMGSANATFTIKRQTEVTIYNTQDGQLRPVTTDINYCAVGNVDVTSYTAPGCVNYGLLFNERIGALQNISEFNNVFEYVRVSKITRKFVPLYSPAAIQAGYQNDDIGTNPDPVVVGGYPTPTLLVYPDRDSSEPVTSASMREQMGGKRVKLNRTYTDSWTPFIVKPIGDSTTGPSQFIGVGKMPWLQFSDAQNMLMYGRRYGVMDWPGGTAVPGGFNPPYAWRVFTTYTIHFKGVK